MKEPLSPLQETKREETECSRQACHNCFENNGCMYYHNIIMNVYAVQTVIASANKTGQEQPVLIY